MTRLRLGGRFHEPARALEVIEKTLGPSHPQVARILITPGNARRDAGDLDQAETLYRRAITIVEATEGSDNRAFAPAGLHVAKRRNAADGENDRPGPGDDQAASIEEVIAFYEKRFKIGLTRQETADLLAFLRAL